MKRLASIGARGVRLWLALSAGLLLVACERPPIDSVQRGYRGTGMEQVYNPRILAANAPLNTLPADTPPVPAVGPTAGQVFQNVKVLNDLSVGEFSRLMVSITAWVAPNQGCTYCHEGNNLASDALYTKVVARRMLQMTRHINADWQTHVAETGVTCYTCHRGNNVPANVWTQGPPASTGYAGNKAGQNAPVASVAWASLPGDPFTPYLSGDASIRAIGGTALPTGNRTSIKQTEWTYGLMMHMSQSLGVNCTYCHNSRSFAQWDTSTPQRSTAWYGIRMVRELNNAWVDPLSPLLPAHRLGAQGDAQKVNCATCHQGAYKPLYGQSMLPDHPELAKIRAEVTRASIATAAPGLQPPVAPSNETSPTVADVLFAVASPVVTEEGIRSLGPVVAALQADAGARVVLSGFTSASGDPAANEALARQRAFAVRDALQAAGVAADRIELRKPQAAEANLAGEDPKARRVEVSVVK